MQSISDRRWELLEMLDFSNAQLGQPVEHVGVQRRWSRGVLVVVLKHLIVDDAAGPGKEVRALLELVELLPEDQIDLLEHVVRIGQIGQQGGRVMKQPPLMARIEGHELLAARGIPAILSSALHADTCCKTLVVLYQIGDGGKM